MKSLTPKQIVAELDKYIVGQDAAKRAVGIAVRNRWRRQQLPMDLRDEVAPKNIMMIGPTGVGKTEIARRLARLVSAPFIKVEAVKFTEVGYIGKDVESMVRELADLSVKMVKEEELADVQRRGHELAEERILDLLVPSVATDKPAEQAVWTAIPGEAVSTGASEEGDKGTDTREKFRKMLLDGKLDDRMVELETTARSTPIVEVIGGSGMEEMGLNLREMFGNMMPKDKKRRKLKVKEALQLLATEEAEKLLDMDEVIRKAIIRLEQNGIIFLDELDKIAGRDSSGRGPDVSREGVQRDILPIVEGCSVNTKYGMVRTDHVLFIAAGAFHSSKPSDLMPELQGRFPIRVELDSLTKDDFLTILTEPKNSLTRQYEALLKTEKVTLKFSPEALDEIATFSALVNERTENIGARRLQTIMEKVVEELSYEAPDRQGDKVDIDDNYVRDKLKDIAEDEDLSRYIL